MAVIFSTQSLVLLALIAGYCGFEASVSFGYNENLITTRHRSTVGTYAYAICVFVVLASAYAELCVRSTPAAPGWQYIGVFMVVLGTGLRGLAIRALGQRFLNEVMLLTDHTLETDSIYGYLRHPAEIGMLSVLLGVCLFAGSLIGLVLVLGIFLPIFFGRIRAEDALLSRTFGVDFARYRLSTASFSPIARFLNP